MGLYGIYGSHSPESCPLNNVEIRRLIIKMAGQLDKVLTKNSVKMLQQYHSGLEHTFLWIVDAQDAHSVQNFMVESGWIKFNALKIVPLTSYQTVIEICQSIGTWLKAEAQSLESDVSHKQLARHLSELYHW